jgi:hypothetical protein
MTLRQGNLGLLESDVARRLLSSRTPARFAYIATDGTPRVLATWFHWTGEVLAMPTFLAAPHVRHAAGRLFRELDGVPPEYASAARRYLGDDAAREYLTQIDQPGTRMARIDLRPAWACVHDFRSRLPSALGGIS